MRRAALLRNIAACLTCFSVVASAQSDCEALESVIGSSANNVDLDQDKLDFLEGDVQRLLDCLPSGATLNLKSLTLAPSSPLLVAKPVSLRADGVPSVIRCGENGNGALLIRSNDVLMSDIRITGCRLNQTSAPLDVFGAKNIMLNNIQCLDNININGAGCMHLESSTVDMHNVTAESNMGFFGGAMRIVGGESSISRSLFRSNNASGWGAGIFLQASSVVNIADSTFEGNHATDAGGGVGGSDVKTLKLSRVDFVGNSAQFSGGAVNVKGQEGKATVDIRGTNFIGNGLGGENRSSEKTPSGGAISFTNISDASIAKSTFLLNTAQKGGAIFSLYSRATKGGLKIKTSTFQRNRVVPLSEFTFPSGLKAGSRGGAVCIEGGEVKVEACKFESNSVEPPDDVSSLRSGGGAIFLKSDGAAVNITLTGATDFIKNSAPFGGAIFAEGFMLEIDRGTYEKNDGGAIYLDGGGLRSLASIRDATFRSNRKGGVFFGDFGGNHILEVLFHRCKFLHNVSPDDGGAIHMRAPRANVDRGPFFSLGVYDSIFRNNKAGRRADNDPSSLVESVDGEGGAVFLQGEKARVEFERVEFYENVAGIGGAISARSLTDLLIQNSSFVGGQAFKGGALAVFDAAHQSLGVSDAIFLNNTAQEGGAVFVKAKDRTLHKAESIDLESDAWPRLRTVLPPVMFSRVRFEGNQAVEGGGAMDLRREQVVLIACHFSMNGLIGMDGTGRGGALKITDFSRVKVLNASIESSFARSGGGMYVEDSCFSGTELQLKNNTAFNDGGAIAAFFGPILSCDGLFPLSILSSTIIKNTARVGGGLHIVVASGPPTNCTQRPAVATDQRALFKYLAECTGKEVEIFKKRQTLVGNTKIAKNDAIDNGPAIFINDLSKLQVCCGLPSSCASGEDIKRTPCGVDGGALTWKRNKGKDSSVGGLATTIRDMRISPKIIRGHASGKGMQDIRVKTIDAFDQPAFERATLRVKSLSSNAVLSHSPVATDGVVVAGEVDVVGLVLKARPGKYELLFTLDPEDEFAQSVNRTISVIVRDCLVGEISLDGGYRCQECGAPFFSFDSSEARCQVCPKDAVCDGSTLTPNVGFWHHDSHSPHIHKCECRDACEFPDRVKTLSSVSAAVALRHRRAATTADGYAQCNQGFDGVLCGSCLPAYGKVRSLDCTECPSTAVSRVIIGLALLSLAVVSLIFVKSAARFSEPPDGQPQSESLENNDQSALPENDTRRFHRASDVVKILVNFLQVTGTAAAINMNWTEGMLGVLATMGLFSGISDNTGFLGFECAFTVGGAPRSIRASALMICMPAVVWLAFLVFAIYKALREGKQFHQFKTDVFVSLMAIVQVSYLSITQRLVRVFYCLDVAPSEDKFWAEDTSVVCYESWHKLLVAVLGAPLLVLVTIGFPGGLLLKLLRNRGKLQERQILSRFGSFYTSYKDTTAFWEVVILLRKALLSTITVFARQLGSGVQGDLAVFVMIASVMLQMQFQPFNDPKLNRMELASVITSTTTFMVGNLVAKADEQWVRVPLSVLMIGPIVIFVSISLYGIVAAGKNDFKRWLAGKNTMREGMFKSSWGFIMKMSEEKLVALGHFWKQITRSKKRKINRDGEP